MIAKIIQVDQRRKVIACTKFNWHTRKVEVIGRVEAESTPSREKRSGNRRHSSWRWWRFRAILNLQVPVTAVAVVSMVKILCRRRRRICCSALPKRTETKQFLIAVRLLPVSDRHRCHRTKRRRAFSLSPGKKKKFSK